MSLVCVTESNLSAAWLRSCEALVQPGVAALGPVVVTVTSFLDGAPAETPAVRALLDATLLDLHRAKGRRGQPLSCETVAGTIFPVSLWAPNADRRQFYGRYLRALPRLQRDGRNRRGLYFARLIQYGRGPCDGNQLEHMIRAFHAGVRRVSAFQATLNDPAKDATLMPLQGFPCLQQIAVHPNRGTGGLAITGFYGTQYLFERAYGNYLGLCRLGHFLAHEMGLRLSRMTCVASHVPLEQSMTKAHARRLINAGREQVELQPTAS